LRTALGRPSGVAGNARDTHFPAEYRMLCRPRSAQSRDLQLCRQQHRVECAGFGLVGPESPIWKARIGHGLRQAMEGQMKRVVLAMLALCALASPTAAQAWVVISSEGVEAPYYRQSWFYAADGKEFLVEVRGVPFAGMNQEAFDQALMNVLMSARPSRPAAQFTTRPVSANFDPSYRLVLVFGPARNLGFQTQCQSLNEARFEPVASGQVRVSAAFCRKDDLLSRAVAQTSARDINDPAFRDMFVQLFPVLFPVTNPLRDGRGRHIVQ
jgi:hypothetical protein